MENIQNPENKITTWWKKVLLILGVYIGWWLVFYGGIFLIPEHLVGESSDGLGALFLVFIFFIIPALSFFIPYKLSKIISINSKILYTINIVYIPIALYIFYVIVGHLFF